LSCEPTRETAPSVTITPTLRPEGLTGRWIADAGDRIDVTRPQPAETALHGPHGDIARRIDGPDFNRGAGHESLGRIEVVARTGAEIGVVGHHPYGGGERSGLALAGRDRSAGDRRNTCQETDERAADVHEFHP
jgi:hypothetical protein